MAWKDAVQTIDGCHLCELEGVPRLRVPVGAKFHPPVPPPRPTRLLFVAVAPPWGGGFFWDESREDRLRGGLLRAVSEATRESIESIEQFRYLGFYLLPAVRCPSEDDGRDHPPSVAAIRHCERHLLHMLEAVRPERIVTLGQVPLRAVSEIFGLPLPRRLSELRDVMQWVRISGASIPVGATYFAGNNRHRGFADIVRTIEQVLSTHTERKKA